MKRIGASIAVGLIAAGGMIGLAGAQTPAKPAATSAVATTSTAPASPAPMSAEGLFKAKCGYCHLPGGTGTIMLERRLGKDKALLGLRTDLPAEYVIAVARNGVNSMPNITRVEASDEELARIAAYIAAKKKSSVK